MFAPKSILVANPKGGCGKSTIAINLACALAHSGRDVVLIDHDEQETVGDWAKARPPKCIPVKTGKPNEEVAPDYTTVHDLPAAMKVKDLAKLMTGNYRLVIPILPSPNDIKAGIRFLMKLQRSGHAKDQEMIAFVANRVKSTGGYFRVLKDFLAGTNFALAATLRDTQNYIRSAHAGLSIYDLPKSRVGKDQTQFKAIIEWLDQG